MFIFQMKLICLMSIMFLVICFNVEVKANIPLGQCSLLCGENEIQARNALTSQIAGPPGKRGAPGLKGLKGDRGDPGRKGRMGIPGSDCDCSRYEDIATEVESLKNSFKFILSNQALINITGWYRASNNFLYKLSKTTANYSEAKKHCENMGTRLASAGMRDKEVKSELYQGFAIGSKYTWIGLDDLVQQSRWMWSDGIQSTRENTDWDDNQPDGYRGYERCGHFWGKNKFNDILCSYKAFYLCEKEV